MGYAGVSNQSVNFGFLAKHGDILVRHGALAERYVFDAPNAALVKIRQLAETLAKRVAAQFKNIRSNRLTSIGHNRPYGFTEGQ